MRPEKRLRNLLRVILRNFAANTKRFQRNLSRIVVNDMSLAEIVPDAHSTADVRLEARETVAAVYEDDDKCVRMLLRMAMGDHPTEIARDVGRRVNTVYASVQRGRNTVMKKHRNAKG
jgi:DNA-directed RNA polymerase specialized sigma24 family protein